MKFDYNSYGRSSFGRTNTFVEYYYLWIPLLLLFGSCMASFFFADVFWVTDERASEYILEMTNAESIEILNDDGNELPLIHDLSDVTFDVRLTYEDGSTERQQFRCTDGMAHNLICRSYND